MQKRIWKQLLVGCGTCLLQKCDQARLMDCLDWRHAVFCRRLHCKMRVALQRLEDALRAFRALGHWRGHAALDVMPRLVQPMRLTEYDLHLESGFGAHQG